MPQKQHRAPCHDDILLACVTWLPGRDLRLLQRWRLAEGLLHDGGFQDETHGYANRLHGALKGFLVVVIVIIIMVDSRTGPRRRLRQSVSRRLAEGLPHHRHGGFLDGTSDYAVDSMAKGFVIIMVVAARTGPTATPANSMEGLHHHGGFQDGTYGHTKIIVAVNQVEVLDVIMMAVDRASSLVASQVFKNEKILLLMLLWL